MADERKLGRRSRQRAELERKSAEIDQLEPYVHLAREIQLEVERLAFDETAVDANSLTTAIEAIPRVERERMTRSIFERLPVEVQWAVIERAFGGDEIREYLADEHRDRVAEMARRDIRRQVADVARTTGRLDTADIPPGEEITVGLFREADARAAVTRGHLSDTCARQLVLRNGADGLRVVGDVFNPRGGYFVTSDYDEQTWRRDRLDGHALVQIGAIHETAGGPSFDAVLYPGGRVDVATDSGHLRGQLHLGFVMLGPIDVFAD